MLHKTIIIVIIIIIIIIITIIINLNPTLNKQNEDSKANKITKDINRWEEGMMASSMSAYTWSGSFFLKIQKLLNKMRIVFIKNVAEESK